uniref:Uncharacterized protein n=1 Tax=Oryza punctata TaxID=4537 RepID=A0A0E0L8W8_ORYPU
MGRSNVAAKLKLEDLSKPKNMSAKTPAKIQVTTHQRIARGAGKNPGNGRAKTTIKAASAAESAQNPSKNHTPKINQPMEELHEKKMMTIEYSYQATEGNRSSCKNMELTIPEKANLMEGGGNEKRREEAPVIYSYIRSQPKKRLKAPTTSKPKWTKEKEKDVHSPAYERCRPAWREEAYEVHIDRAGKNYKITTLGGRNQENK